MASKKVIDTSPRIIQYGVRYANGNPGTKPLIEDSNFCITDKYEFEPQSTKQTLITNGVGGSLLVFWPNGNYYDYWTWSTSDGYWRTVINVDSGMIACSISISVLDRTYAYLGETGQILFAGKNSPYYGYSNINDMPTQKGVNPNAKHFYS